MADLSANVSARALANDHVVHSSHHHVHQGMHDHHAVEPPNPHAVLVLYLVLFTLVLAQLGLVWWKSKHKRSYDMVTLLGLWLIPPTISIHLKFWVFVAAWLLFSAITGYLISLCMRPTLHPTTPRMVFTWFLAAHKICIFVGGTGYAMLLLELLGAAPVIGLLFGQGSSFTLLWYGLYFGILGRDAAEVASDRMASQMAFGRRLAVNPRTCGLCQKDLEDFSHVGGEAPAEPTIQLGCKHVFHELCIKGWTMVGKKDVCPTCMEKVDLKALYADRPWETRNLQWISMLDFVRYMVVWNPIILFVLHLLLHAGGLDDDHSASPPPPPALGPSYPPPPAAEQVLAM